MTIKIQKKKLNLQKPTNVVLFTCSNLDIKGLNITYIKPTKK